MGKPLNNPLRRQIYSLKELAPVQSRICFDREMLSHLLGPGDIRGRILITGCGDSLAAAQASLDAFRPATSQGQVEAIDPVSFSRLTPKSVLWGRGKHRPLVIVISSSGSAIVVREVLEKANAAGALTLFITNREDSPAAKTAARVMQLHTPDEGNTPGLRSYFASMVGLMALAAWMGECGDRLPHGAVEKWREVICRYTTQGLELLPAMDKTVATLGSRWNSLWRWELVAEGVDLATAYFTAQKFYECGGSFAVHSTPSRWLRTGGKTASSEPIVTAFLAGNGPSPQMERAFQQAILHNRFILWIGPGCPDLSKAAVCPIPLPPEHAPWVRPLLQFIPLSLLAAYCATGDGREFFGGSYRVREGVFSMVSPYKEALEEAMPKAKVEIVL